MKSLKKLSVPQNGIKKKGMAGLLEGLRENKELEVIKEQSSNYNKIILRKKSI